MDDLISRQDAIDALGEKPLVWDDFSDFDLGKAAQWSDDVDAIKALPSAQPKSSESKRDLSDTISRQAALDAIRSIKAITGTSDDAILLIDKAEAQTELVMLPSAQPQRMKGRWEYAVQI